MLEYGRREATCWPSRTEGSVIERMVHAVRDRGVYLGVAREFYRRVDFANSDVEVIVSVTGVKTAFNEDGDDGSAIRSASALVHRRDTVRGCRGAAAYCPNFTSCCRLTRRHSSEHRAQLVWR